ncbi:A/G-specific adenine glycosylase [Flavimarina sp. Hel_I_48]|uniref:A/G-specific adenine glycosylase n=1 Tax=Flavimarina sp. Hel_I_48 TaxID=1392488 RepID=UPI0004DF9C40|nr:A/G-specific adenine glycosylase [Flavimarina sp. Hel_I_48]
MNDLTNKLISWYLINKRELPWRNTIDPYSIWLSEIILQQTRVDQGMPYYFSFVEKYPTVHDLAKAPEDDVLKLWQGLGYYSRARNLHATAKMVSNERNGKFPDTYKGLKTLKGVGDYTASAIASICFGEDAAVVDGNVYRVLSRVFGIDTPINTGAGQREFKALAQELIDPKEPALFNQAIMEFGAIQCKPKNPYCLHCPLNDRCVALKENKIDSLPVKKGKVKVRNRYFNYLVFMLNGKFTLLKQRTDKGIWRGLFEFPLLESENNLDLAEFVDQLKNQTFKEENIAEYVNKIHPGNIQLYNAEAVQHKLSHQHLFVKFWIVQLQEDHVGNALIPIENIHDYAVPRVIDRFLETFDF